MEKFELKDELTELIYTLDFFQKKYSKEDYDIFEKHIQHISFLYLNMKKEACHDLQRFTLDVLEIIHKTKISEEDGKINSLIKEKFEKTKKDTNLKKEFLECLNLYLDNDDNLEACLISLL